MNRSGCGMRPKIRPVGSHTPATARRSVGVGGIILSRLRIPTGVSKDNLAGDFQCVYGRRVGHEEAALAVGHRQLDRLRKRDERREARPGQEPDPSVFEPAGFVGRERGRDRMIRRGANRTHQHLEPVANAENQAAAVMEPPSALPSVLASRVARMRPAPRSSPYEKPPGMVSIWN